ncbi:MAG: type VI secretion system tip protein VgrG [Xanthomonadales bacterium]|nr:type VI secretion system tip protein VgrG [Xanthomonadales bacterium]
MPLNDANHPINFISPLGDKLVVESMSGDEAIGQLFNFQLELLSEDFELQFSSIVGQKVTVGLELAEGRRHFNGFITEFRYLGQVNRYARYQAVVRPWLWFLTRTSDCKIFQELTVPEIIEEVFADNEMSDFEIRLTGSYRKWEYCVQYRETDYNFISRLMEQEGLYFYFEHDADKHILVLADDPGTHKPFPGFETIPFHEESGGDAMRDDHLQQWVVTQTIQPEQYAVQDFNFKKPKVDLLSRYNLQGGHAYPISNPEIFDYPGEYIDKKDGDTFAEIRLQELRLQFERISSAGPCRGLSAGCVFTLEDYPREDQNNKYLVLSVFHQLHDNSYISSRGGAAEELYRCSIEVLHSEITYRQPRATAKPMVQGPQTAIVVGPENDEIYTDEFGRVKVQFHWDRYGLNDEDSSCWIRVSQLWAGTKWGGMHIPRIGQEVIVSFLEGDPDRPLITGRVYNADCMPPYTLPENKTQSGIKSRSSKNGTENNFNEIRMEDKKGSEELYIQAEKNEKILVKNNKSENVGNNESITIGNDRTETIGNDETTTIGNDRTETVVNDEYITIGRDRIEFVVTNEHIRIGEDREENVGNNETIEIGNDRTKTVCVNETITIGADRTETVANNETITIGNDRLENVVGYEDIAIGKDRTKTVTDNETITIGKKLQITAGDEISFICGSASITLKKNGDIKIKGKNLSLNASSVVNIDGKPINLTGTTVNINT